MELWKSFKAKVDEEDDTEEDIKTAFKTYDIDGDGYITKDEMVTVKTCSVAKFGDLSTIWLLFNKMFFRGWTFIQH